jgi:hypothetical protein
MLDLIESCGKWNSFDGPKMAAALKARRDIRRAVVITDSDDEPRFNSDGEFVGIHPDLGALRVLASGHITYDIVRAVPKPGQEQELEDIFVSFHPDRLQWISFDGAAGAFERMSPAAFAEMGGDLNHAVTEAWWD